MSNVLTVVGAIGAVTFAVVGLWTFSRGQYMIAGTCFILLSFAIYLWETHRER